ncbi:heavy-metal-associated domain-containing protein [Nioella nitratireducens]|uniref:heavy-metal-associated domain-containing protein n=1 Tax=Nioella nitratireducens TaxID=1287720 RepID=UPI0008FD47DF|nr:cation transporter [Nioella nitratireducens]
MKFTVPDMSCGHCVAAIEKAVAAAGPGLGVACDLESKTVALAGFTSTDAAQEVLRKAGYEATPAA